MSRYENTITGQFFGHTHFDEFEVFYDHKDLSNVFSPLVNLIVTVCVFSGRPNNIAFVGPSVSPYYDLNPGYRIYYVDGDHDKSTRVRCTQTNKTNSV